jgi:exosortase/archaeosortase family protein
MELSSFLKEPRYRPLRDVALFGILILGFHFLFRFWAYQMHYWPVHDALMPLYDRLSDLLYYNSKWVLQHLTDYDYMFVDPDRKIIYVPTNSYVKVNHGCSGLKQFLQWIVLMTFFPGPWKKKLWFIPLGLIIIHLVNIFRISGLSVVVIYWPQHWHFIHDYVYRPFFYVVMFGLWVWWVEKFRGKPVR